MGKARGPSIKYPPTPACAEPLRRRQAKASEGYPPVAKSAEAAVLLHMNELETAYAFIHGQSLCLHAEVPSLAFLLYRSFGTQAWSSA